MAESFYNVSTKARIISFENKTVPLPDASVQNKKSPPNGIESDKPTKSEDQKLPPRIIQKQTSLEVQKPLNHVSEIPKQVNYIKKTGKQKGIQGRNNSCYLDSTLMALFYVSSLLDNIFLPQSDDETKDLIVRELKSIIMSLRSNYYCPYENTERLRKVLGSLNKKLQGEMMDVEELITTLCGKALNLKPFICYTSGTSNYYHQLVVHQTAIPEDKIGRLQLLLLNSLKSQGLEIQSLHASLFLVKMPRANGKLIGYKAIIPPMTLNIPVANSENVVMELQAVICLRHCHYTCFLRSQKEWYYFDSMAGEQPQVSLHSNLEGYLNSIQNHLPLSDLDPVNSNSGKQLIMDIHFCVYVDVNARTGSNKTPQNYSTTPPAISRETKPNAISLENKKPIVSRETKPTSPLYGVSTSEKYRSTNEKSVSVISNVHGLKNSSDKHQGFIVSKNMSGYASLLYMMFANNKTIFNRCIENSKKAHLQKAFINPLTSLGYCESGDEQFKVYSSTNSTRLSPLDFLKKIVSEDFICYNTSKSQAHKLTNNPIQGAYLVNTDEALRRSMQHQRLKFNDVPNPLIIVVPDGQAMQLYASLKIDISASLDNKKAVTLDLQSVICNRDGLYTIYDRVYKKELNGFHWIYHDPTSGIVEDVPDLEENLKFISRNVAPDPFTKSNYFKEILHYGRIWMYTRIFAH